MKRMALLPLAWAVLAGAAHDEQKLALDLQGLRSAKGQVLVCVTRRAEHFPDCGKDPDKRHFKLKPVAGPVDLTMVPPGDYAVSVVHDENGNGRLDTFMGIPREGVGFSRNPTLRVGAPSFKSVRFTIVGVADTQMIRLKYFL